MEGAGTPEKHDRKQAALPRARFAAESLADISGKQENKLRQRENRKAELLDEITAMTHELVKIKEQKNQTAHHIRWGDLPKEHQFEKPLLGRKRLMDAVCMIACRSETALCTLLTNPSLDTAAARCLLQTLFTTEADIRPDLPQGQLLFAKLNEIEIVFSGAGLILHYQLVGSNPDENSQKCVALTSQR